jgi:triosephosphate isomerase (TIM)
VPAVELAVFPPSVYIDAVRSALADSRVAYGAQNMYPEANGAYTGEISAAMLVDLGCRYVILGHSERRHILGESDKSVSKKAHAALAAGLTPIVCVGELLAEREAGQTREVIAAQFAGSLGDLSQQQIANVVIAYEPVWAIGTGKTATPEIAAAAHRFLRQCAAQQFSPERASALRILYGGSVKPDNIQGLMAQEELDGALVGGASLDAKSFASIVNFV